MQKTELKLDWATYEAAKYACRHWHYSKSLPATKLVKIGVWENGKFIGVVIFSRGAAPHIGDPYNLPQTDVCELTRVALRAHETPVTKIVSIAIKMLKRKSPNVQLIVSYADPDQKHLGVIYQAGNWIYEGVKTGGQRMFINGKWVHQRTITSYPGRYTALREKGHPIRKTMKFKYLMPLNRAMKAKIEKLNQNYPKRLPEEDSGPTRRDGANPIQTLQTKAVCP